MNQTINLTILPERFCICRLQPGEKIPAWADHGGFFTVTRTADELSIICPEVNIPDGLLCEKGWRALKLVGPFEFTEIGILAGILSPLAAAGVSILAVSTFDTDFVLVKQENILAAGEALRGTNFVLDLSRYDPFS